MFLDKKNLNFRFFYLRTPPKHQINLEKSHKTLKSFQNHSRNKNQPNQNKPNESRSTFSAMFRDKSHLH
jgi:hypothetical protein